MSELETIGRSNLTWPATDLGRTVIMIITSIFKEDNVFSMIASLPYGPPVNTDIDYYLIFSDFFIFVSVAMLVDQYLLGEVKPVLAL